MTTVQLHNGIDLMNIRLRLSLFNTNSRQLQHTKSTIYSTACSCHRAYVLGRIKPIYICMLQQLRLFVLIS